MGNQEFNSLDKISLFLEYTHKQNKVNKISSELAGVAAIVRMVLTSTKCKHLEVWCGQQMKTWQAMEIG